MEDGPRVAHEVAYVGLGASSWFWFRAWRTTQLGRLKG